MGRRSPLVSDHNTAILCATAGTMKKQQNNSGRGSTLQITLSVALISISAILLVVARPTNTKKTSRQVTATEQPSGIMASAMLTAASPTTTPAPCGKIAFVSNRDGNDEIYAMNADGSNQTRLTNNAAFDNGPSFGRDGSKIAFISDRDGNQRDLRHERRRLQPNPADQ